MRNNRIIAVCVASVLILSGLSGCAAQAIQAEEKQTEERQQIVIEKADSQEHEPDTEIEEPEDFIKLSGTINQIENGSIFLNRLPVEGEQVEVQIQFEPEKLLILDSSNGLPVELDTLEPGDRIHAYVGPTMTMSEPAQFPAVMILTNISEDSAAPEYVIAASALTEDGQGGYILTGLDERKIPVPAACEIIPYLTKQIVKLSDITEGSRLLVWKDSNQKAEKIVLFHE